MPLQNRVDPWGHLNIHPSKQATLMGNRGALHNDVKQIIRTWRIKAWISCVTQFKGNKRALFSPNRYSELFFLDEATAFAAGHRPCAECQRPRSNQFKIAWLKVNSQQPKIKLSEIDEQLHIERISLDNSKITFEAGLQELPIGTSFEYNSQSVMVVAHGLYLVWTFDGYTHPIQLDEKAVVKVLTPKSIVNTFKTGFTPTFHPTAEQFIAH